MPYTAARKVITSAPVNKASSDAMHAITPLGPEALAIRVAAQGHPTRLMSIVNMTPDSFSDGGTNSPTDQRKLMDAVRAQIAAGATIIDIGGQSSRPNAPDVTAEEEIARILPAIEAIKALPEAAEVAISVDTYRAAVAEAAVNAGAHIINDISAGQLDTDMLATVARLGCTYVMMHMRGTPATMQNEENLVYPDDVLEGIVSHLQERTEAAQRAGIRRWRIILDPGLGFSKTTKQNLYILQKLQKLRELHEKLPNYAWLIGSSRKSFIGEITGVDKPKDRVWGTAATVTAAVQGGAQIVRVHDVHEMAAVVKMADAIYRD